MYEYGHRVRFLRQRVLTAEALAAFLLGVLPERVVEDTLPRSKEYNQGRHKDIQKIEDAWAAFMVIVQQPEEGGDAIDSPAGQGHNNVAAPAD